MTNRALFIRRVFIQTCLGGIVFISSACAPATTITETPPPTPCTSPSLNPYHLHPPPNQVSNIFSNYKSGSIYEIARQEAFVQLGENIKQWSDYKDVRVDDQHAIRISITYLDPILIQYVLLNYSLTHPNYNMTQQQFESQITNAMKELENLNEVLFMVTVTSPGYTDALPVKIPIRNLRLTNASGIKMSHTHHAPMLDQQVDITRETLHGIVGYPVSVLLQNGNCIGIMDQWTNDLALNFEPPLETNSPYANISWNISLKSLVSILPQNTSFSTPTMASIYDTTRFAIATVPPTPNWNNTQVCDKDSKFYWEEMGRYIWSEVLMGIDH